MGERVRRTLPELLDAAVDRSPSREVVLPGERASWPEVRRAARAWAAGLVAVGVLPGDRVLLVLPGGLDAVRGILGAALIGAVPTPVNPRATPAEVAWLRGDADPAAVVAAPELVGLAGPGALTPAELVAGPDEAPDVTVTPDDPMILLYTSGTTSRPRGCVHTHAAYAALGENLVERLRLTSDDRFWTPLPLHHCGGIDVLMGSLAAACTLVHVGAFEADLAWRQLVDERATVAFPAFDTIWLPVLGHPAFDPAAVPALRTVINVGPAERMAAMQARLPTAVQISCLGGTESAGFCCVGSVDDPPEARAGTSGVPLTGMEATVRDPVTGRECGPGEVGEFLHRGVSRMAYYHRDPATTAERIDTQGWFHTGDLVRRDGEGRFTFVSRLKDMLKVGGENVAAAEVEGRLAEHPAVGVVAVVAAPDARLGEVAAAYVELTPTWRDTDRDRLTAELVGALPRGAGPVQGPPLRRGRRFLAHVRHQDPEGPAAGTHRRRPRGTGHRRSTSGLPDTGPVARGGRPTGEVTAGGAPTGRHLPAVWWSSGVVEPPGHRRPGRPGRARPTRTIQEHTMATDRRPAGRSERRATGERKPREERWAELLEVATQVFYEKGYDGASLQDIADRLGMLKGSLYYYIQSKEDLLFEVISEVHREGYAVVSGAASSEGDPLERLERTIRAHVEHACRHLVPTAVFLHELEVAADGASRVHPRQRARLPGRVPRPRRRGAARRAGPRRRRPACGGPVDPRLDELGLPMVPGRRSVDPGGDRGPAREHGGARRRHPRGPGRPRADPRRRRGPGLTPSAVRGPAIGR